MNIFIYATILLMIVQNNLIALTGLNILSFVDEFLIVMIAVVALFKHKKTQRKYSVVLTILLLLFLATGVLSCIINSDTALNSLVASCFLSAKFWILVLSISKLQGKKKTIETVYDGLFFAEKIVLIVALINLLLPGFYHSIFVSSVEMYRFGLPAVCSTFDHPGKYGWFMLFCALAHLSKFDINKDKKELIKTIISVAACLMSLRTKVIIGIVACVAVYLFSAHKETIKKQMKKIIVFAIVAMCILVPLRDIIKKTYVLYFTDKEGYSVRQALTDNGVKIAKDYMPIGVGFGKYGSWYAAKNYSEYYYKYKMNNMYGITPDDTSYATDTFWPSIIGETGVLGCILFVAMVVVLYRWIIDSGTKNGVRVSDIKLFASLALVQMVVESFGSASFSSPPDYFFSAIVIGLALAYDQNIGFKTIREEKNE